MHAHYCDITVYVYLSSEVGPTELLECDVRLAVAGAEGSSTVTRHTPAAWAATTTSMRCWRTSTGLELVGKRGLAHTPGCPLRASLENPVLRKLVIHHNVMHCLQARSIRGTVGWQLHAWLVRCIGEPCRLGQSPKARWGQWVVCYMLTSN